MAQKYRISVDIMKAIIKKYKNINNFLSAYKKGEISGKGKGIGLRIRRVLDIDFNSIQNFDKLVVDMLKVETGISNRHFRLYSSSVILDIINNLPPIEKEIIIGFYGLETGTRKKQIELSDELGISTTDISRHTQIALTKVRDVYRERNPLKQLIDLDDKDFVVRDDLDSENGKLLEELESIVFNSNSIFYPLDEYMGQEDDIDKSAIAKIIQFLVSRDEGINVKESSTEFRITEDTKLEHVAYLFDGNRLINLLKRKEIFTVGDLINCDLKSKGILPKSIAPITAVKKQILEMMTGSEIVEESVNLDSSIDVLKLRNKVCDMLIASNFVDIRGVINAGVYGLMRKGISQSSAEAIWRKIEELAQTSPQIKQALDIRSSAIKEKQDKYRDTPIRNLKKLFINVSVQYCLEELLGIETVGQLAQTSEDSVRELEYNKQTIKQTLGVIRKVKGHYENGSLEKLLDEILEKDATIASSIAVLNLSTIANKELEKINCVTVGQVVASGGVDGLIIKGISESLAEQIWRQVEKLSSISPKIEETINIRRGEIREKQKEYQDILISEIKNIPPDVYSYLKELHGIENIGQLIEVKEDMVWNLECSTMTTSRILGFIKRVKHYYEGGHLEDMLNRVYDKDATLDSSISVLNLTAKAQRALTQRDILNMRGIIEAGKYGLEQEGISKDSIEEIWRQTQRLAIISPEIEEAIKVQEDKIEEAKDRYKDLPIENLRKLPTAYLTFFQEMGIKTVGALIGVTEEQILEATDIYDIDDIFKYIRMIEKRYNNADLESIMKESTLNNESREFQYIVDDIELLETPFALKYNRLRKCKQKLNEADVKLAGKAKLARELFREIALNGSNRDEQKSFEDNNE